MANLTDTRFSALAAAIQSGGDAAARAMDELVRNERNHLARTLWQSYPQLREDVEDIVVETFERLWTGAAKCGCFREGGTYAEFRKLAQKQASFLALSKLRTAAERRAKADMVSVEALEDTEDAKPFILADGRDFETGILANLDAELLYARLRAAQAELTERQRIIAQLMMTLPDSDVNQAICAHLHVSEGAAREAKRAVRQKLRRLVPI